jgi:hypothetical protein
MLSSVAMIIGPVTGLNATNDLSVYAETDEYGWSTSYNPYFGDLHAHSDYSDGWGTPVEAFTAARDNGADFFALTDHHYQMTPEMYIEEQLLAASFTTSEFVAMAAYEYYIPGVGEMNIFNTTDFDLGVFYSGYTGIDKSIRPNALPSLYDAIASREGGVGMWVHPLWAYSKQFEMYDYLTPERDHAVGIFEMHNLGSWVTYSQLSYEPDFILALDAGWHVMPSAVSDTHLGDWIWGYDVRTVLLADELTTASLYDAMSEQRGYATLDKNLQMYYELNGQIMGTTLSEPTSEYTAHIHVEDPDGTAEDEITLIEVVSDGGMVVATIETSGTSVDVVVDISSEDARYFYIRISTASNIDGGEGYTAWSSPVWTGR